MTTILVTGGAGFTGTFVVGELTRRGHRVRVLSRRPTAVPVGAELVLGDLEDLGSVERAARGVDAIVHVACTITHSSVDIGAMETLLANWPKGPFVFISSLDVYGFAGPGPITEDAPLDGSMSEYAQGKVTCEQMLIAAAKRANRSDHATLRAPYIWGPHPVPRERLVKLIDREPLILPGRAPTEWSEYRDAWIDVRDLATIVGEVIARPVGGPLNVLNGHFAWHDLFTALIRLTGGKRELVHKPIEEITDALLPRKELYIQRWRFSADRLARQLGTNPKWLFEDTVRETMLSA